MRAFHVPAEGSGGQAGIGVMGAASVAVRHMRPPAPGSGNGRARLQAVVEALNGRQVCRVALERAPGRMVRCGAPESHTGPSPAPGAPRSTGPRIPYNSPELAPA
ncbi:hypothetical protein GCM10022419_067440 [Nonomuraea rosea]|uniref:Uncharacterized protein n=1 Tax=Nonomuraea rosea TaxID=638574 RepID=A0ABP6Y595_9ACTN